MIVRFHLKPHTSTPLCILEDPKMSSLVMCDGIALGGRGRGRHCCRGVSFHERKVPVLEWWVAMRCYLGRLCRGHCTPEAGVNGGPLCWNLGEEGLELTFIRAI